MRLFASLLLVLAVPVLALSGEKAKSAAAAAAVATAAAVSPAMPPPAAGRKRYLVLRTFPAGVLDGLDAAAKEHVNQTNASFNVKWVQSFANADKTRTFCVYDSPNPQAIRDAAKANMIPVDDIIEIPIVLLPQ